MAHKKIPKIKVLKGRKQAKRATLRLPAEYRPDLLEELKDPDFAAYYLTSSFEEGGLDNFLRALHNVIKACGGVSQLAKKTGLERQSLYTMFSAKGNPSVKNLVAVLESLNLGLSFYALKEVA